MHDVLVVHDPHWGRQSTQVSMRVVLSSGDSFVEAKVLDGQMLTQVLL